MYNLCGSVFVCFLFSFWCWVVTEGGDHLSGGQSQHELIDYNGKRSNATENSQSQHETVNHNRDSSILHMSWIHNRSTQTN